MMTHHSKKFARLSSIDVFRGVTIAVMIIVNSPGNPTTYHWITHSSWNGCTLADLVFPFFIFILGVSLVFSLSKQVEQNISTRKLLHKITKRCTIIFLLGLFLNAFPEHFNFSTIRVFGVLQRIAICYFFAALLFLISSARTQTVLVIVLLVGYWMMMTFINIPVPALTTLSPENNLASYIDRLVFSTEHLYGKIFDPEGFLSTVPAIATALLGNLTGIWLRSKYSHAEKLLVMLLAGILAVAAGWLWGFSFPINKALWTSSYVLWTGGFAICFLAFLYWLIEIKNLNKWFIMFEIFGVNAIAAYFLHRFFLNIQTAIQIPQQDGSPGNLRFFLSDYFFGWSSMENASLFYAVTYTILWLIVLYFLYRKRIYIKI